ncbi:hypothetical protein BC940DRAFT_370274, partial [Gongronella butleri]
SRVPSRLHHLHHGNESTQGPANGFFFFFLFSFAFSSFFHFISIHLTHFTS